MSSSGGGLESWVIVCRYGVCLYFPVARVYTIIGTDVIAVELVTVVWVLTVATVAAGVVDVWVESVGGVSTLTLYLLFAIMVFLLLSGIFVLGP